MSGEPLAKQQIEFSTKGFEAVKDAFTWAKSLAQASEEATRKAADPFDLMDQKATSALGSIRTSFNDSFQWAQKLGEAAKELTRNSGLNLMQSRADSALAKLQAGPSEGASLKPSFDMTSVVEDVMKKGTAIQKALRDALFPPSTLDLLIRRMKDLDEQFKAGKIRIQDYSQTYNELFRKAKEEIESLQAAKRKADEEDATRQRQEIQRRAGITDSLAKGAAFKRQLADALSPPSTLDLLMRRMADLDRLMAGGGMSARDYNRQLTETFGQAQVEVERLSADKNRKNAEDKVKELDREAHEVALGNAQTERLRKQKEQQQQGALSGVHRGLVDTVGGFMRQGIASSGWGAMIGLQFQFISREVASLFLPAIQQATHWLGNITGWFRSLSSSQQDNLAKWITLAAAAAGAAVYLPRIANLFSGLKLAMMGFTANPLLAVIAGMVGLMATTEEGRESLASFAAAFAEIGATIAEMFAPALKWVADLLSSSAGKWIVFGTVAAFAIFKITGALIAMQAAMGPVGWISALLAGITIGIVAFSSMGGRAGKAFVDGLVKEIKAGRKTMEEAVAQIREEGERKKEDAAEEAKERGFVGGVTAMLFSPKIDQLRIDAETQEQERRLRDKTKGGHRDIGMAGGPFEGVEQTWQRLQVAAMKISSPELQEAKQQTDWLQKIWQAITRTIPDAEPKAE